MIGNPIITKELVSSLRSRAATVLAIVFVSVLSTLALFVWPEAGINPVGWLYSRLFFNALLNAQLIMLALFSPPFSATSITGEREAGTWEMLYYSIFTLLVRRLRKDIFYQLLLVFARCSTKPASLDYRNLSSILQDSSPDNLVVY